MTLNKTVRLLMSFIVFITSLQSVQAQEFGLLNDIQPPQQSSEFIFRSSPKESLITIQLLGAVNKPGIYYVPANTDLLKLLTLAGGTTNGGDLSEVLVRKMEPNSWREINLKAVSDYQGAYEVDAEKLIRLGGAKKLHLQHDDFVYVPPRTPWISAEASRNITIVSIVLGIVLTAVLIDKNTEKNK